MEFYKNWYEEKRSAYLYAIIAENEKDILRKKLFSDLKEAAEKQARIWEKKIKEQGSKPPPFIPDVRTRLVRWLIIFLDAKRLQPMLSAMKIRGMSVFSQYHNHSEHRHTSLNASSNLRAAVFGMNDGLVSNISLILGVTGANADHHVILLAGIAGLLAGACSMGAGEYISVRSQREVFEYQLAIEKQELEEYPEEETEELSLIYQARGIPQEEAHRLAKLIISNPQTALNTLAREELGLNPDDLVSPLGAMLYSFFSFALGAIIPIFPFLFGYYQWSLAISIGITAITLFTTGSILSLFSNKNPIFLGFRMMVVGSIAGGLTFLIGKLLGIAMY